MVEWACNSTTGETKQEDHQKLKGSQGTHIIDSTKKSTHLQKKKKGTKQHLLAAWPHNQNKVDLTS